MWFLMPTEHLPPCTLFPEVGNGWKATPGRQSIKRQKRVTHSQRTSYRVGDNE